MSKSRKIPNDPIQDVGPGNSSLYYNNKGLFFDPFLDSLKTSKDPFLKFNWDTESYPQFSSVYEWMLENWADLSELLPNMSEAQLEDQWIRPIFKLLGWTYQVQTRLQHLTKSEIPDYTLFSDISDVKKANKAKTNEAYFGHALVVADAKTMGICLDGNKLEKSNPSYQIMWYQKITGIKWGILTDGRYWRLYCKDSKSNITTYYEVNVEKLLVERDDKKFKHFFNFFRKDAFISAGDGQKSFVDVVFDQGNISAKQVEHRLKDRAYYLVQLVCQGFAGNRKNLSAAQLKEIHEHSLYLIFRLMFVLNCEGKGLLNISKQSDYYLSSLRALSLKLQLEHTEGRIWSSSKTTYHYIFELFSLLESGDSKIGVHGFGVEFLSAGDENFYNSYNIPNSTLNQVILDLSFSIKDSTYILVDYKSLSSDHLGSIFEGLLEYKLSYAPEPIYLEGFKNALESTLTPKKRKLLGNPYISKGELYLEWGSTERSETGSFYTPDFIVDHVVAKTLEPLCEGKSASELLKIRVIDPTMGSGHFLLGVVKFLEEKVLEATYVKDKRADVTSVNSIRWKILHNCIYGIDINPLAIELAKFSLWIYTAANGFSLEPLSDQFILGNSVIDTGINANPKKNKDVVTNLPLDWGVAFKDSGGLNFDAVVGNPPFNATLSASEKKYLKSTFGDDLKDNLNSALIIYLRSRAITVDTGYIGLVMPKSVYFSNNWQNARKTILPYLLHTSDVSEAFKDAKIEEVVIICSKKISDSELIGTSGTVNDILVTTAEVERSIFSESKIFFSGLEKWEIDVREKIICTSASANTYLSVKRGFPVQNLLTTRGENSVIRCKTIKKYYKKDPIDFIAKKNAVSLRDENVWLEETLAVVQNIVAHVTKPVSQIILMAAPYSGELALDSVGYVVPENIIWNNRNMIFLTLFNSWITSWYMYRFCYAKAIRTMRFDNYHLEKMRIPIPLIDALKRSSERDLLSSKRTIKSVEECLLNLEKHKGDLFEYQLPTDVLENCDVALEMLGSLIVKNQASKAMFSMIDLIYFKLFDLDKWTGQVEQQYRLRTESGLPGINDEDFEQEEAI